LASQQLLLRAHRCSKHTQPLAMHKAASACTAANSTQQLYSRSAALTGGCKQPLRCRCLAGTKNMHPMLLRW
jgi:hypothetical protein